MACGAQLVDVGQSAFEAHRTPGDSGHLYQLRIHGFEPRQLELIHLRRSGGTGLVHGIGELTRGQIPGELAGLLDIAHRVFPTNAGKTNDGRDVVEGVEETVGRQIHPPARAPAGNPSDRPWTDDGVKGIMRQSVPIVRLVGMRVGCHRWVFWHLVCLRMPSRICGRWCESKGVGGEIGQQADPPSQRFDSVL